MSQATAPKALVVGAVYQPQGMVAAERPEFLSHVRVDGDGDGTVVRAYAGIKEIPRAPTISAGDRIAIDPALHWVLVTDHYDLLGPAELDCGVTDVPDAPDGHALVYDLAGDAADLPWAVDALRIAAERAVEAEYAVENYDEAEFSTSLLVVTFGDGEDGDLDAACRQRLDGADASREFEVRMNGRPARLEFGFDLLK